MKAPDSKFEFGQTVFIVSDESVQVDEPCKECDKGKIHIREGLPPVECPVCKGRGHNYKCLGRKVQTKVYGELTINRATYKCHEKESPTWFDTNGWHYQGSMKWYDANQSWNVFSESKCYATLDEAKAAEVPWHFVTIEELNKR